MFTEKHKLYENWLSGEITAEELEAGEKNAEKEMPRNISSLALTYTSPEQELNAYLQIQSKLPQQKEEDIIIPFYRRTSFVISTLLVTASGFLYFKYPDILNELIKLAA